MQDSDLEQYLWRQVLRIGETGLGALFTDADRSYGTRMLDGFPQAEVRMMGEVESQRSNKSVPSSLLIE